MVQNETGYKVYVGRGDTGPYAIDFEVQLDDSGNAKDVYVFLEHPTGEVPTDITATCTFTGLNVYTTATYAGTDTLTLIRIPNLKQLSEYNEGDAFPAKRTERDLDKIYYLLQYLKHEIDTFLKAPISEAAALWLPSITNRRGKFLAFEDTAAAQPIPALGVPSVPATSWAGTLLDDLTLLAGQKTLGLLPAGASAVVCSYIQDLLNDAKISTFMKTVLDDADAAAARATIGSWGLDNSEAVSSTPFTQSATSLSRVFLVTTGASNLVFNIASAATLLGKGPYTIVKVDAGAGAVAITPNGADIWRNAGNVACYLGKQWESITFVASASGQLSVLDGVFVPSQAVDTNGSQLHLGKLIHLPINNTSRAILSGVAPGAVGVWSAARQVTGSFGVPAGAKAVRVAFLLQPYSTAAGICFLDIVLSDNNTSTPTGAEAHPRCAIAQYASAAAQQPTVCVELDVPLNAAGQFYNWTITAVNVTLANSFMQIVAKGYYMGV